MRLLRKKSFKVLFALAIAYLVLSNLPYRYSNQKAADYVTANACNNSRTMCAWYCMRAMQRAGAPVCIVPAYAYADILPQMGFKEISVNGYKPQKGDISVLPTNERSAFGHIAIYNGVQWVSDFKQKSLFPSSAYRRKGEFRIYRIEDGWHWGHVWTTPADWIEWGSVLLRGRKMIDW